MRYLTSIVAALVALCLLSDAALAWACCSNRGYRYVAVEQISEPRLREIANMTFDSEAALATGEADAPDEFREFGTKFALAVERTEKQLVFSFRGEAGSLATLTLAMPGTISIFQVDPRSGVPDDGLGPLLYKEWQLTSNAGGAGTGVFRSFTGPGQMLSLILHGRGHGCTEAGHFTDWTLLLDGPSGHLTLYGALTSAFR
ncbi:hypothetical protein [Reyranella sp.]|uniref:hypothetical protein n=1 Tax=Reyranella sp. TaxID=1929291 RepID=UPI0037845632